jgi:uncharacterized protein YuzE
MIFRYFADTDMLYVEFTAATSVESEEVAPGVVLDYDADGGVVGIEFEDASTQIDLTHLELSALPLVNLVLKPALTAS